MDRKQGAVSPFCGGGVGFPSCTMCHRPRPTCIPSGILIHAAVWPRYIGQNWGGCCAPFWGERGPHLTECMSPGPRSTSVPSGILIHPAAWPQYTRYRHQTDRLTDNSPIAIAQLNRWHLWLWVAISYIASSQLAAGTPCDFPGILRIVLFYEMTSWNWSRGSGTIAAYCRRANGV